MANVIVEGLSHGFGSVEVLQDISFTIADGEFFTLVGPSGCGKSTTLMAIAGLLRPRDGRLEVGGRVFLDGAAGTFVRPERRNIGLMFQSYALWPHMTVRGNLMFPLRVRKVGKAESNRRIDEVLDLVEMLPYADRYPGELSGGQQQRVALARTLVYGPSLLLLDEPLSNLDAKLRDRARMWLRELQQRTGITTIYVTHDQAEALSLSDRVAVLDRGRLAQVGPPREIYARPANRFVADFIGKINVLCGDVVATGAATSARLGNGDVLQLRDNPPLNPSDRISLGIRPERIRVLGADEPPSGAPIIHGEILGGTFEGARFIHPVRVGDEIIRVESADELATGPVRLEVPTSSVIWLPS
jgi:iron(III) transport system ATP-binding protein